MRATSAATTRVVSTPLRRSARLASSMAPETKATSTVKAKKILKEKPQTLIMSKKPVKTVLTNKTKPITSSVNGSPVFNQTLSRDIEARFIAKGYLYVVGVDEAGRGPLAGPVVAAACYIPSHVHIEGIHDSKKLDEKQREFLFEKLTTHKDISYSVHINNHERIDEINILQATLESMCKAVESLNIKVSYVLVDGNRMPNLSVPGETVVKGDSKCYSIAAASIIAKVTRDRLMVEYDQHWPIYGLAQHKGYGTKQHMAAISKHGPCPIHRMTFAPLNQLSN